MIGLLALWSNPLVRYGIAIAGVLALLGAIYAKGHSDGADRQIAIHEAYVRQEQANAAKLTATRIAENMALEAATEAHNAQLEETVANARQETATALGAYNRAVADRMRLARSRPARSPPGTTEAPNAGSGQNLGSPSIELSEQALRDLGHLAAQADELVSVMGVCRAWALEHGR